ncbi:hypothetical protein JCM17961_41530 [Endothiovibrio diazotrophicus]
MKVQYLRNGEYQGPDITIGKVYLVIDIEADSYRIINDSQMPYLYDPPQFEIVEYDRPSFWVTEYGEEQEEYSYPFFHETLQAFSKISMEASKRLLASSGPSTRRCIVGQEAYNTSVHPTKNRCAVFVG